MDKPFQKVASHALIKKGDKYLITLRSKDDDYQPGLWDLPGGSIKVGEEPENALAREVKEEVGLKVKIVKPLFVCSNFQNQIRHQFWIVYECEYIEGEVVLNEEHDEFLWATKNEINKLDKIFFFEKFSEENL